MGKVLSDHKQHGKKFIAPYNQIGNISEFSWTDNTLPELIWIDLMIENLNQQEAVELCRHLICASSELYNNRTSKKLWFAPCSSFSKLKDKEIDELREELKNTGLISKYLSSLEPLVELYDDFPMKRIFRHSEMNRRDAVNLIKDSIKRCIDKTSKRSTYVIATGIYGAAASEMLFFVEDSPISDINEIQSYPNTDESKKIASLLRATINSLMGGYNENVSNNWPTYFWNQNYRIDKCDVNYPYEV